jgi:superoxide dismutase, Cu-Zn family
MRNRLLSTIFAAAIVLPAGLAHAQDDPEAQAEDEAVATAEGATATAELIGDGIEGTVTFTETPTGIVIIEIQASGVPAGAHGVHFHETGSCDAEGGHESAGGHIAGDREHGVLNPNGPHPGDLPNVHVQEDGIVHAEFFATDITIAGEGDNALLDGDGSAFVLHAGPDDYLTDPAGNSGDRIACGVIEGAV